MTSSRSDTDHKRAERSLGCTKKPEPCNPSPCGTNAECIPNGDNANCKCPAGYQGDPFVFCKKGECEYDHECDHQLACFDFKCRDPCIGTCGQAAECQVSRVSGTSPHPDHP